MWCNAGKESVNSFWPVVIWATYQKQKEAGHGATSPLPSPLATSRIANRVDGLSCPRTTEVMRPVILRNRLENLASILAPRSTYPV